MKRLNWFSIWEVTGTLRQSIQFTLDQWHCWNIGSDNSFLWGAGLCNVEYLTASLASSFSRPVTYFPPSLCLPPPQLWQRKLSQDLARCPWWVKITLRWEPSPWRKEMLYTVRHGVPSLGNLIQFIEKINPINSNSKRQMIFQKGVNIRRFQPKKPRLFHRSDWKVCEWLF